jgi:hypothetical protein
MSLILRNPNLVDVALSAMNLIDDDRRQYEAFKGDAYDANDAAIQCWTAPGFKWAICDESGLPLAVAGCELLRPSVYQTWFLSGNEIWETYAEDLTAIVRKVKNLMLSEDAKRIQTICLESRTKTRAWYEKVGMHFECVLPYYGVNGESAVMYAAYRT